MSSSNKIDYKSSGVDVVTGDKLVDWLQSSEKKGPHQERVVAGIGGFASLFRIGFPEMKKPCLVTCTDGVGTKVKIAAHYRDFAGVGQDLVAMCVNDLICTGGRPLLFLDYYATGKLNLEDAQAFLKSVRNACEQSDCALVGGETAEMPGVYANNDFDCAGFAVGIVDEDKAWGPHRVQDGDVLLGVASSGCHSNGYSLLRKIFAADLDQYRDELLTPTRLYVKLAAALSNEVEIHAAAHITGGGLENLPRVLPAGALAQIQAWELPPLFQEIQKRTGLSETDLRNTLNCGLGFVFVVPAAQAEKAQAFASTFYPCWKLGEVSLQSVSGEAQVQLGKSK